MISVPLEIMLEMLVVAYNSALKIVPVREDKEKARRKEREEKRKERERQREAAKKEREEARAAAAAARAVERA